MKTMQDNSLAVSQEIGLLAETSWEVCNKIGGIYTVLSTKARILQEKFGDRLVFIGPDFNNRTDYTGFIEDDSLFSGFTRRAELPYGIKLRAGRWDIPGSPQVILTTFDGLFPELNGFFGLMWEKFRVESLKEYGDYREGCAFSIAVSYVIKALAEYSGVEQSKVTAHFNEWTTGMGLLNLQLIMPSAATVFTTHATSIGRSISGNWKPLYDYFANYDGDQMAAELNMEAKHSLEKRAAQNADCFTAVSELTARECRQLLGKAPDVVTPNGFEPDFVPGKDSRRTLRKSGRRKILDIVSKLKNRNWSDNTLIVATAGRNEFRNKGIDLFIDSIAELSKRSWGQEIVGLIMVPAWVKEESASLAEALENDELGPVSPDYLTHRLNNEDSDLIALRLKTFNELHQGSEHVTVIFVPCYLDGHDGIVNISYYDILPAIDITVFPSYYEPWGYTPLESVAFGIPSVMTDKSGFGQWILSNFKNSLKDCGAKVIERMDSDYSDSCRHIADEIINYASLSLKQKGEIEKKAFETAEKADWKWFFPFYEEAYVKAFENRNKRIEKLNQK